MRKNGVSSKYVEEMKVSEERRASEKQENREMVKKRFIQSVENGGYTMVCARIVESVNS